MTELCLIAALDRRGAIGRDNTLPWRLPDDLRRFKALTFGKPVVMGRRTAESLGRALPGRRNLVLSRSGAVPFAGMERVADLHAALASVVGAAELWVIGGGEIYALCLPRATRLYLTHVDTEVADADAFFPPWSPREWRVVNDEAHAGDDRHAFAFRFTDYVRLDSMRDAGSHEYPAT